MQTNGLHHVTAISGPARRNLAFHAGILGLRLVKRTVNFDDPGTYHLYYGDETGSAGTVLTFFPWEDAPPGQLGTGETIETQFRVPGQAIGYWQERFAAHGVAHGAVEERFGAEVLPFQDPDGMRLALVAVPGSEAGPAWSGSDVPPGHAIRGFHGVSLLLDDAAPTAAILSGVLGFTEREQDGAVTRLRAQGTPVGGVVDLHAAGTQRSGRMGGGSVHHIAFRAADDAVQAAMVRRLAEQHGIRTTEQKDRDYFRSVYFREPGGVLFEIATDIPGFTVDEPAATLGQALKLPRFLQAKRDQIERVLPALA